jgi:hypothetical protein
MKSIMSWKARSVIGCIAAWCVFWWGYSLGMSSSYATEVRSLRSRLALWEAIVKERGGSQAPSQLYELDKQRLSELGVMSDLPILYFVLAPIVTPYSIYELNQIRTLRN